MHSTKIRQKLEIMFFVLGLQMNIKNLTLVIKKRVNMSNK